MDRLGQVQRGRPQADGRLPPLRPSVHLDHRQDLYRKQVRRTLDWEDRGRASHLLAGDFNATPDSNLLDPLRQAGLRVRYAASHGGRAIDQHWHRPTRWLEAGKAQALDGFSSDPPTRPGAPRGRAVNTEDARSLAIVAIIAVAPLAIVLIFLVLRGYTIDGHLTRGEPIRIRRRKRSDDDEV